MTNLNAPVVNPVNWKISGYQWHDYSERPLKQYSLTHHRAGAYIKAEICVVT